MQVLHQASDTPLTLKGQNNTNADLLVMCIYIAGDEAELLATATSVPKIYGAYPLQEPATADNKSSFDARYSWGPLSPMFSVDSFGLPKASMLIPEGCKLDQVHLVHRHGSSYEIQCMLF